jgi:hypothetical protein
MSEQNFGQALAEALSSLPAPTAEQRERWAREEGELCTVRDFLVAALNVAIERGAAAG